MTRPPVLVLAKANRVLSQNGSRREFVALAVLGTLLIQALWIAVVPPFRGSDEADHAFRAAAVAGGHWRASLPAEDGRGLLVEVPKSLVSAARAQCSALPYTGPDNCNSAGAASDGRVLVASGAANYNPAFYWVIGTAAKPFSGAAALYAMRVTGALICLVFIGLSAWAVAQRKSWSWTGTSLFVAMTPVMLYSTAIAAPNGLEMAVALALWTSLAGLDGTLGEAVERRLLLIAIASAMLLVTLRMLGPMFMGCILLTTMLLNASGVRRVVAAHLRLLLAGAGLVAGSLFASVAWIVRTGSMNPAPEPQGGAWTFSTLLFWPLQAIAAFPFRDQPGPIFAYPVVLLGALALVIMAFLKGSKRESWTLILALLLAFLIPVALTVATYEGRGAMWQGRYGLPYSVGFVLIAGVILDRHHRGWPSRVIIPGAMAFSIAGTACLLKVLWDERERAPSAMDASWHAPDPALVLFLSIVAWTAILVALLRSRREPV